MSFTPLPDGVYPVMLTPFTADGAEVDYKCLFDLAKWYLESGSAGLFPVAQSSEMYTLNSEERLNCAKVVKEAAGDKPVLASGTFDGTPEEQAAFINLMAKEVDVVIVLVSMLCKKEDSNEVWMERMNKILELTPGVPMGIYECPAPYHRLLTPEMLTQLAATGRFLFIKDTSRENTLISKKINALSGLKDSPFRWYNGNVTTTLHSLKAGGNGYGGVSANFYPWVHAWLCANHKTEPEKAVKVQRFLTVAEMVVKTMYPQSAKEYLNKEYGFPINSKCRVKDHNFVAEDYEKLNSLKLLMEDVCAENGITPVEPKTTGVNPSSVSKRKAEPTATTSANKNQKMDSELAVV